MKKQKSERRNDRQKTIIICFLYFGALCIVFLGIFFSAYSAFNGIDIQVLNVPVPGIVFGMLVTYLGVKYLFMVSNFKTELNKNTAKFSWSNFKKDSKIRKTKKINLIIGR